MTFGGLLLAGAGIALAFAQSGAGAPTLSLMLRQDSTFRAGTAIEAEPGSVETFELILANSRARVDPDSVHLLLNGIEIVGFARLSRMPSGMRVFVDRTKQNHPFLKLSPTGNRLEFEAEDDRGNVYRGNWTIQVNPEAFPPVLAAEQPEPVSVLVRKSGGPPEIRILADPAVSRVAGARRKLEAMLHLRVADAAGLKTVFIYVNGKEIEVIQLRNGLPSRRRGKFRRSVTLPGSVAGGSNRLEVKVPVLLPEPVNLIRIVATNVHLLQSVRSVTIARPKR